jgi:DNA-binding beta-propeller fold protein YncE
LAQAAEFEYLFTLGAKSGVNPAPKMAGRFGKLFFGAPERISPLMVPAAVAVDREDRVWITDRGAASVHMFDLIEGQYKLLRGADKIAFQCPSGIDSDVNGSIYVADACSGLVFVFDREGSFVRLLVSNRAKQLLQGPTSMAVAPDLKSIYLADPPQHKVLVLNQEGQLIQEWRGFDTPSALALTREKAFVLDTARHHVQVFSLSGKPMGSLTWPQAREPSAFAVDPERKLFFVGDPRFETVQVFDERGSSIGAFGQSGSGAGEVRVPSGIHIDFRGRIYVVDPLNGKVLVFRERR